MLPHQGPLTNDVRRGKFQRRRRGRRRPGNCPVPRGLSRRGPSLYCARRVRRGGRVAEGARLESVYTGNRIVGSNPTLSANALFTTLSRIGRAPTERCAWPIQQCGKDDESVSGIERTYIRRIPWGL